MQLQEARLQLLRQKRVDYPRVALINCPAFEGNDRRIPRNEKLMKAILYAAGRAMRLGEGYAEVPKILVEFGGKSLLEWNMQRLAEIGIQEVTVVTGHKNELIRAQFGFLRESYSVDLTEIFNEDYTEGSVLSVHVSLPGIIGSPDPVLLMDGDVLYSVEILRRLVNSRHRTALLIDRGFSTADDDPVLVPIRAGKPVDFLKKWKGDCDQLGESVGFFKVDPSDIPFFAEETEKRVSGIQRQESYDEVIRSIVLAGRFSHEDITGIPWTEIDFPGDIEFARNEILPAIDAYESNS